ncbi:MAG: outer membrane protein assembly factor BamA [Pseudomonadota bacterium]|nr:outer membrane protein assembly factor BamA [Pseudomonadota bacterium]MDE3037991.1 outer membrane protein assembly factor BamA [Pseudomonadota bacterium]
MKLPRLTVPAAVYSLLLAGLAVPVLAADAPAPAPAASTGTNIGSGIISDIKVEGNQRIEANTVLSYFGLKTGENFNQADIDAGLKSLYATGFFSDVKLTRQDNALIVHVAENPVISRVAFEGNDRIETKDLEKEVELKARSIYSQDKVQNDVKRILDIYRRSGRYAATVTPKIIKQDQNRVDLVYEISEGPVAYVEKIRFIGNDHFSGDTLRKTIRTEEYRWYRFLSDDDKFDPDRLQFDQDMLRRFYNNEGYADFQVKSATADLSPAKDAFYITFVIEEGPLYRFGDVKIDNTLEGKDKPDLSALVTTRKGDIYNAGEIEHSIDAMTKELGNHGYAFVDIEPKIERDRGKRVASLTYAVKPGPRVYVERINITGNVRTLDEVIRREFRLNEGDPYNTAKLQRSEERLNNLSFFKKVDVKTEPGSAPDKTVINANVEEKSTGEINVGAGYSTTDGPLANFGVAEHNLLGTGQELKTNFMLSAYQKDAEVSFTNPYFLDRELAAGVDVYRNYQDFTLESSYISDVKGVNLRMSYPLQEHLQHSMYYTIHRNTISNVPAPPFGSIYILEQEGTFLTSAIGQTLAYDRRDNKLSPTRGYFLSLTQEVAGLGGNDRYLKHEAKASYYIPVAPKWTLSFLGAGGYIFGFNGQAVRITNRFFLGGDDFRGFFDSGVGPHDTVFRDALGGDEYYEGTTELNFPLGLPDELGLSGAVFTDAGSLWGTSDTGPNVANSSALRLSTGVGLLWTSPFGPIRIYAADPILKQKSDQTQVLRFSFGTRF